MAVRDTHRDRVPLRATWLTRPYWNASILAPRSSASSGPAVMLVLFRVLRRTILDQKREAVAGVRTSLARPSSQDFYSRRSTRSPLGT